MLLMDAPIAKSSTFIRSKVRVRIGASVKMHVPRRALPPPRHQSEIPRKPVRVRVRDLGLTPIGTSSTWQARKAAAAESLRASN